jgi:hypothetical protein
MPTPLITFLVAARKRRQTRASPRCLEFWNDLYNRLADCRFLRENDVGAALPVCIKEPAL